MQLGGCVEKCLSFASVALLMQENTKAKISMRQSNFFCWQLEIRPRFGSLAWMNGEYDGKGCR